MCKCVEKMKATKCDINLNMFSFSYCNVCWRKYMSGTICSKWILLHGADLC
jgi:hypothetical protein